MHSKWRVPIVTTIHINLLNSCKQVVKMPNITRQFVSMEFVSMKEICSDWLNNIRIAH
jgi:hypothetical protein